MTVNIRYLMIPYRYLDRLMSFQQKTMNVKGLLLLPAFWLAAYATNLRTVCPPYVEYPPCSCETVPFLMRRLIFKRGYMVCESAKDVQRLEDAFRNHQPLFRLIRLILNGCVLDYIPYEEAIRATRPIIMHIKYCTLQRLFGNPPSASDLQVLIMYRVSILHGFDWKLLANFKLKELRIGDSVIKAVDGTFGRYFDASGLQEFWLYNTKTRIHLDAAFAKFVKVRDFRLVNLALKAVPRSWFPRPWNSIDQLTLSKNEIRDLSADFFDDMPNLKYVDLNFNQLSTLFLPNPITIEKIYISYNPLFCNCDMKWVINMTWPMMDVTGECSYPLELRKKTLSKLKPEDFEYCR